MRQSYVNTKVFEVDYVQPEVTYKGDDDDDKAFQRDLVKEKNKVNTSTYTNTPVLVTLMSLAVHVDIS